MFAKYHYLSHYHNNASNVYVAIVNNQIAGFISIMPLPGKEPRVKRVHRLVILPDFQGAGFGVKFLHEIGKLYKNQHYRFTIVTSAPSLIYALQKDKHWSTKRIGRMNGNDKLLGNLSKSRITASFELK